MLTRLSLFTVVTLAAAACTSSSDVSGSIRITNDSDFALTEIHVTPVDSGSWGPNLLNGDILAPGEDMTVDTSCDTFDVLLVDQTGVSCELHDIDLCLNDADFVITNNTCTVFDVAAKAKAAAQQKTTQGT